MSKVFDYNFISILYLLFFDQYEMYLLRRRQQYYVRFQKEKIKIHNN